MRNDGARSPKARGDLLLGIDLGTTALKAGVFGAASGRMLAAGTHRLGVRTGDDGAREQAPADVVAGLKRLVSHLRAEIGRPWSHVAGIGLAAQGGSAILCDRQTGAAFTPMQLWNDTRPLSLLADIATRRPSGYWRRLRGIAGPGAGLARIEWLRRRYPSLMSCRSSCTTRYAGAGEYTFFQLTGVWRQDAGNALQIGCYSVATRALVAGPLETVGVTRDFVAPLRQGHETQPLSANGARLLGLPAGLPVAGPYIDHEAGYLSAAGTADRPLQCSLGTAWVGNFVAKDAPPSSWGLDLVLPSPVDARSLILRVMAAGNVAWDWALDTLVSRRRADALMRADAIFAESLLPPDGLVGLPWFTRPNAWDASFAGNGGFLGMNARHTPADLLRALAAGMAFEFAGLFTEVKRPGIVDRVILGGGASQGRGFQQLLAALFAPLPVFVAGDQSLAGARGSIHAFSPRAAQCAVRRIPCPGAALRQRIEAQYRHYVRVRNAL